MDDKEQNRKTSKAMVVCTHPDVCKSPVAPVPYQIVSIFEQSSGLATSVNATSQATFTQASQINGVIGDEGGTGEGVKSGTHAGGGITRPVEWSSTVRAEGKQVVRHDDQFTMNTNNTDGKAVFPDSGGAPGGVDQNGKPKQNTNPDGKPWYKKAYDQAQAASKWAQDTYKQLDQQYGIGTRIEGFKEMRTGAAIATAGAGLLVAPEPTMLSKIGGGILFGYGVDKLSAGAMKFATGKNYQALTDKALGKAAEAITGPTDAESKAKGLQTPKGKMKNLNKELKKIQDGSRVSKDKDNEKEKDKKDAKKDDKKDAKKDETPQEKPAEQPAEKPAEQPAEAPKEMPAEAPKETPEVPMDANQPVGAPTPGPNPGPSGEGIPMV